MDSGYHLREDNPKRNSSWPSKLLYVWIVKLFYKGRKKGLQVADLYRTLKEDRSDILADKLNVNWELELHRAKKKNERPSLLRAISNTFLLEYMVLGVCQFLGFGVTRMLIPVALAQLIKQFTDKSNEGNIREMSIYSGILTGLAVLQVFAIHHTNFYVSRIGMRIRVAVSSLIYRKITRLNQHSFAQTASGQVINLLSNDVIRFDFVVIYLHSFWMMPILVVMLTYFIWSQVGISSLAGVLSMLMFSVPVQGYLGKLTGQLRHKIANKTDARVKLMSEIVSGIQVIKMYAWEKPFEHIVKLARKTEVSDLTKTSYLRGIYCSSMVYLERLTLFLTLMSYSLLGHTITADKVFSLSQFYNILQTVLAINFPMAITYGSESLVSIKRLEKFLHLEEKKMPALERLSKTGIIMSKVSASWSQKTLTLKDISIEIPSGTLCAIVGPVGAGKSSILQLIMGELPVSSGKLSIGGEIAYSSQNPWLFAGTIRNNILFGQPYSKSKYDKTVEVCCLTKDFEQLPSGDKTVVGERGVSLSGGQRARINLARAIYRVADIYLLDDPLSAVDAHVGKQMFDECIYKYLKSKTRILVTHQLQYLKRANLIIIVNDGKIEAQGSFEELSRLNMNFSKILLSADGGSEFPELADHMDDKVDLAFDRRISTISSTNSTHSDTLDAVVDNSMMDEETSDQNARPINDYFKSTKRPCSIATLIIMLVVAQAACSGADYFSAFWSQQEEIKHANDTPIKVDAYRLEPIEMYNSRKYNSFDTYIRGTPEERFNLSIFDNFFETVQDGDRMYNVLTTESSLYIYGTLIILVIVLTLGRSILFFAICMEASKNLHSIMFHSLLSAPMRFFDTNPCGRILNRFSKDMGAIDEILPTVLLSAIQIMLVMLGILVNISVANPYMIIAIVLLGALFDYLRKIYISTAKDIKHLEGITKSPVFSHISSTLNGLTTIRAAKIEGLLTEQFDHHQDIHTSSWYLTLSCTAAFGLWLDLMCVIFVGSVMLSFILLKYYMFDVNGALVGLAISQSLILTGMVQTGMRLLADVVNQLTSVERVLQYTKIDTEKPFETQNDKKRNETWPSEGKIDFIGMSLKYIEDEPEVLKNLTFTIYPGQKIGIVGRTGAGKSSLIAALFRLSPIDGCITIDGVVTKEIALHDLRKKISIIPQEPVLFSASMRYNLDPFGEYEDSKLWNALDEVELKSSITSLDYMVHEGGANFSLGQRQLICLARAILRQNKILVMDEATANVDPQTDAFIQETIRKKFKDCTVLTIAHRLNTIMDSDKVLVMNFGSMVEFDHPHKLLQIPEGYFYSMVQETGPSMSMKLKEIAMETYKKINQ